MTHSLNPASSPAEAATRGTGFTTDRSVEILRGAFRPEQTDHRASERQHNLEQARLYAVVTGSVSATYNGVTWTRP